MFEDGSYSCSPGVALIGKVLAGRCKMNYTRAAVGKGSIPEGKSPKTMTEPADYVMEAKIAAVTNPVNGECQVTVQINSSDVEKGFFAKGILLYAQDPDKGEVPYTYLVLENGPEWIRPSSSIVGKLATFDIIAAVGEIDSVTARIDSDTIVTKAAVEQMLSESIIRRNIVIPATGWVADNTEGGEGGVYIDIEQEDVTEKMIPLVSIFPSDMSIARDCGISTTVQTIDGAIRFFAEKAPTKPINTSTVLIIRYAGAAEDMENSNINIDYLYKHYVATQEEVEKVLDDVFEEEKI